MLGGIAPILIIHLKDLSFDALTDAISGIPLVGDSLASIGVPVPIYLDEKVTGILVDSETKSVEIETQVDANHADPSKPIVKQNGVDSTVTLRLIGKNDSLVLAALLALIDQIFARAATANYSVTYLNGPTLVFNSLLKSCNVSAHRDNDLLEIDFVMSKANLKLPNEVKLTPDFIPKVVGP